jgi:hypothetical protein
MKREVYEGLMMLPFWVTIPCRLSPEDGDSTFIRNVANYLRVTWCHESEEHHCQLHCREDLSLTYKDMLWTQKYEPIAASPCHSTTQINTRFTQNAGNF